MLLTRFSVTSLRISSAYQFTLPSLKNFILPLFRGKQGFAFVIYMIVL